MLHALRHSHTDITLHLLKKNVTVCSSELLSHTHPQEHRQAESFSSLRQREYLRSRFVLHKLLGDSKQPILKDQASGRPLFAKGILGSISHKNGQIVCAIKSAANYRAIGIDIEKKSVPKAVIKRISSAKEQDSLKISCPELGDVANSVIFSSKEAIYKAYSSLGLTLRLDDIMITEITDNKTVSTVRQNIFPKNHLVKTAFSRIDIDQTEYIISSCAII